MNEYNEWNYSFSCLLNLSIWASDVSSLAVTDVLLKLLCISTSLLFSLALSLNLKKNFFSMWGKNEKMVWAISTFSPHSGWFLHFYDWLPPYPVVDELTYTCVIQCYNAKSLLMKMNVSYILRWVCFSLVRLVLFQSSVLINK